MLFTRGTKFPMLVIRHEQILVLADAMRNRFESEACEHVRRYFPGRCLALGEQALKETVGDGLRRARAYGFQSQFDLLRFLNLLFEFGLDFDRTEEHQWARPFLEAAHRSPTFQMDSLMEEAYKQLYTAGTPLHIAGAADLETEPSAGFDGLVWEDSPVNADYQPQSIEPVYEPIFSPPPHGSLQAGHGAASNPADVSKNAVRSLDQNPQGEAGGQW
jgi:hypothetical protein